MLQNPYFCAAVHPALEMLTRLCVNFLVSPSVQYSQIVFDPDVKFPQSFFVTSIHAYIQSMGSATRKHVFGGGVVRRGHTFKSGIHVGEGPQKVSF